jgi:hypothetical protein
MRPTQPRPVRSEYDRMIKLKLRPCLLCPLLTLLLAAPAGPALADHVRVGGTVSILPVGQIHAAAEGFGSDSADTATAVGLGGMVEIQLATNVAVGFAPRLLLNVKGEDGDESAQELDLAVRLIGNAPVGGVTQLYGFVAPGYSILFIPEWPDEVGNPAGFIFGLGGGAAFDLNPQFRLGCELGYQLGWQQVTEQGATLELQTDFLHLGMTAMARF